MTYTDDRKYTKEHEWVRAEGAAGTVGITHHAQEELGDIVYVDLPKVGAAIAAGSVMGSVESVKAVSDIFAPVSGKVTAVNELLATSPEKLNDDPHGDAWLIQVELSDPAELTALLSAADYEAYIS